jgi:hypothetical protein
MALRPRIEFWGEVQSMCIGRNMRTARLFRLLLLSVTIAVSSLLVLSDARAEILVVDDFENPARSRGLWDGSNDSVERFITDSTKAHSGSGVLELKYDPGTNGPGYMAAYFPHSVGEVYVRWYEKFSTNWVWSGIATKMLFIQPTNATHPAFLLQPMWGGGTLRFLIIHSAVVDPTIYETGASLPNDRWHCIEIRFRPSQGLVQVWLDDSPVLDRQNEPWAYASPEPHSVLISAYYNAGDTTPKGVPHLQYRWIDDVAASTTRIGCLPSTGDKNPPSAPSGLRLTSTGE